MQFLSRALCAAILLQSAAAYAGVYPIYEGKAFTLDRNEFDPEVPVGFHSETASSVSFSLWGMEENLGTYTDSSYMPFTYDRKTMETGLDIAVNEGYKITSIQVSGTFRGELHPVPWTMPGDASNHMGFGLHVGGFEGTSVMEDDVDGMKSFTLSTGATSLEGAFGLWFTGSSESTAQSEWYYDEGWGEQYWLGAQASARITDLVLTVNVSPVPEPGTWAMLLGGLAVTGYAARRRRSGGK